MLLIQSSGRILANLEMTRFGPAYAFNLARIVYRRLSDGEAVGTRRSRLLDRPRERAVFVSRELEAVFAGFSR